MNEKFSFIRTVSDKSPIKVLSDLVRNISGGTVARLEETHNGFVLAIVTAAGANTGAIYVYDEPCSALFMFEVDERCDDFSRREIGYLVPAVVKCLNGPDRSRSQHRRRRRAHRTTRSGSVAIATTRASVAAVAA
jgi:hypothetical protein